LFLKIMVPDKPDIHISDNNDSDGPGANYSPPRLAGHRSLTRLVIGGVLLGLDEINASLEKNWGAKSPRSNSRQASPVFPKSGGPDSSEFKQIPPNSGNAKKTGGDLARYVLIGLVFGVQDRIQTGLKAADQATRAISKATAPLINPISKSKIVQPFHRRYDELVLRGQHEVDRWIGAGQTEDTKSRLVAQAALEQSFDRGIDYLTTNEEIKELIETQSVSLAGEVIEEIRERAVSADNLLEGAVRMILHKPPRSELPAPPAEISEQAHPFVRRAGRIVRKL
jgi:hypothetical protein